MRGVTKDFELWHHNTRHRITGYRKQNVILMFEGYNAAILIQSSSRGGGTFDHNHHSSDWNTCNVELRVVVNVMAYSQDYL